MIIWPHIGLFGEFQPCESGVLAKINQNFMLIDALLQMKVLDFVAELPDDPETGDVYILTADDGDYLEDSINIWDGVKWVSVNPQPGYIGYDEDEGEFYWFNGTDWTLLPATLGDVLGPASSTNNAIARFDGTTGKIIQNSGVIISDTDDVSGIVNLNAVNSITSKIFTGDLNLTTSDYNGTGPALPAFTTVQRRLTNAALTEINDIGVPAASVYSQLHIIENTLTTEIIVKNNANIRTGTQADLRVAPGASFLVLYSRDSAIWLVVGGSGGGGGVMVVPDNAALLAIPPSQRYNGLIVFVESENANYQLQGGTDNTDWVLLSIGTGYFSDDVGAVVPNVREFSDPPTGCLPCNASSYNAVDYPILAARMWNSTQNKWKFGGTGTYPTGTFLTPDMRGMFMRGSAQTLATDPDRASRIASGTNGVTGDAVGSRQGHAFQTHNHTQAAHSHSMTLDSYGGSGTISNPPARFSGGNASTGVAGAAGTSSATPTINNATASGIYSQATADETRPINIAFNFFIRYQAASKGEKGDKGDTGNGIRSVADLTARDAIPPGEREEGMIVYVVSNQTHYKLVGGITNANWADLAPNAKVSATQSIADGGTITRLGARLERVKVEGAVGISNLTINNTPTPQDGDQLFVQGMNNDKPVVVMGIELTAGIILHLMYDAEVGFTNWRKVGV